MVKISENLNFRESFRKFLILLKIIENLAFGQFLLNNLNFGRNFWKISNFVKFFFEKCSLRYKYSKILILFNICGNFEFGWNFRSISIMIIFLKNHKFTQNCRQILVLNSTVENIDFDQSFSKISIFVMILKISILIKIFEKSQFSLKFAIQLIIDDKFQF